jgi:cysteine desulfurase
MESREKEEERIGALRDRLEREIERRVAEVCVNGRNAPRLANTSNLACHYVEGEGMLYQLSAEGICASSGSACTSGSLDPSHVLLAMKVPFTAMHGSIRFSLSRYNTDADIDRIVEVFPRVVANLRHLSPYWDNRTNRPRGNAKELLQKGRG